MEILFLLIIPALVIPYVLPFVAMSRAKRALAIQRKIDSLDQQVQALFADNGGLRRQIATLELRFQRAPTTEHPSAAAGEAIGAAPAPSAIAPARETVPPVSPSVGESQFAEPPAVTPNAAPPSVDAPPDASPETELPAPRPAIEWERWLGVRGAALLSAVALAIAGLYLFKYSIENGLLSPPLRVVLGIVVGIASIVAAERLRSRYAPTANPLAGGGLVVLYASFWASKALYELVDMKVAFVMMAMNTALCCALAVRHNAQVIAVLGLVGGFATPLLLSSGQDHPLGLFGYLLVLASAFLWVAYKRKWGVIALLALVGTVIIQALWIGSRMGPERVELGLGILGVFALLFAFMGAVPPEGGNRKLWLATQAGGVLIPFGFALHFAGSSELGAQFLPVAALMVLLSAAASWIARRTQAHWLSLGAATASLAAMVMRAATHPLTDHPSIELLVAGTMLAALFHLFVEFDRERPNDLKASPAAAALLSSTGAFALFIMLAASDGAEAIPLWGWWAAWGAMAALLIRHAHFAGRAFLVIVAAAGLGLGAGIYHVEHAVGGAAAPLGARLSAEIVCALALLGIALALRAEPLRRRAFDGVGVFVAIALFANSGAVGVVFESPAVALGATSVLALVAMLAATPRGLGYWPCAIVPILALVHAAWTFRSAPIDTQPTVAFSIELATVLTLTAWPFFAGPRFLRTRWAWYASALSGPLWFASLRELHVGLFGTGAIALLPLGLGALALACAMRSRSTWPTDAPLRKVALVWYSAIALCFVSIAIPLQLDNEWITVAWSLEGLSVILLWKRLDHPGLKWFGLGLEAAVTVRLVFNPSVLGYYERGPMRIFNWLLYGYWVPTAALLGAGMLLGQLEVERARPWEAPIYLKKHAIGAVGTTVAAILVFFVWINLAIADWFGTGSSLNLNFEHEPAKDLTTSLAWALYAIILLAIGMARGSRGLRWLSLAFLLTAIGKVFLYDLSQLRDLYRVMSLVGLAISLLAVSLAYQRFVFRRSAPAGQGSP